MPKERITYNNDPYDVIVSWMRDQYVSIGTEMADGTSLLWQLYGSEANRTRFAEAIYKIVMYNESLRKGPTISGEQFSELGKQMLDAIESFDSPQTPEGNYVYSGVWANIDDRKDINTLIKVLRRARDQAFGKDE